MSIENLTIGTEMIYRAIIVIRGHRVMLDADLAAVYGVSTKRLNEQVKRNIDRFPSDFMFQLTVEEKAEVLASCDHLIRIKFSHSLPFAFTEHGAVMLANVLNSPTAVAASIEIVRAFINLREMISSHRELAEKLVALEKKYDAKFKTVFDAVREIMTPTIPKKHPIGIRTRKE